MELGGVQADANALRGAAASINAFAGDGGFMERFGDGSGGGASPASGSGSPSPPPPVEARRGRRLEAAAGGEAASGSAAAAGEAAARAEMARPPSPPAPAAEPPSGNLSVAAALRARLLVRSRRAQHCWACWAARNI